MAATTSRLAIPYPSGSDPTNPPADMQRLANALDSVATVYLENTLANRPAAGTHGRIFYATDTGAAFYDYGTGWTQLNLNSTSVLSTKGDLLVGTGSGAVSRLPIGSDGQVLQANAGASPGLRWADALGQPVSLNGANQATRYVGATTSGSPTTGSFSTGDFVIDRSGVVWICYASGSPGSWRPSYTNALGKPVGEAGISGATQPARFVGGTSSGAPSSGTFFTGDFVVDRSGAMWVCTATGSPGTWIQVGATTNFSTDARKNAWAQSSGASLDNYKRTAVTGLSPVGGQQGGPATYSNNGQVKLNKAGVWSLLFYSFSDSPDPHFMQLIMSWANGGWYPAFQDLIDQREAPAGYAAAGGLWQTLTWTGYVPAAAANAPITLYAVQNSNPPRTLTNIQYWFAAEYLGT